MPDLPFLKKSLPASNAENLDNYLNQIAQAKKTISDLSEKIKQLQSEKDELIAGNSSLFKEHRERIRQLQVDTQSALTAARQKQQENEAIGATIAASRKQLTSDEAAHEKSIADFQNEVKLKRDEIRKLQLELSAQKETNDKDYKTIVELRAKLDERNSLLTAKETELSNLQNSLSEAEAKNKADAANNIKGFETLQSQSESIHKSISDEKTARQADIVKMQNVADQVANERKNNEAILAQIEERSKGLQDKILNLKLLSSDIEKQKGALIAQEEKTGQMIERLQNLKDELSKEPAALKEEAAK